MRVRLAMAAITVATLAVVACHPESSAGNGSDPCKVAATLPGFEQELPGGAVASVPPGRVLVRDASMEGLNGPALTRACKAFVRQYQAR